MGDISFLAHPMKNTSKSKILARVRNTVLTWCSDPVVLTLCLTMVVIGIT